MDKATTDSRSIYACNSIKQANHHCNGYPFISRCNKSKIGKCIDYCKELGKFHKKIKENITNEEKEKKFMFKRYNEAEVTFVDFKKNMGYDKIYRRGLKNVQMEIYLVAMGYNIKKY